VPVVFGSLFVPKLHGCDAVHRWLHVQRSASPPSKL
jgi:hypothetical protein